MSVLGVGGAPGKLLLLGEHAVVYGHPAVGFPLSHGVKATLRSGTGLVRARLGERWSLPEGASAASPDDLVRRALGDDAREVDVELELDVPPMSGYGSSAAVAVALLRAHSAWRGAPLSRDGLWARALEVEEVAHARPSGVDPAVVVWGEPIVFRRDDAGAHVEAQPIATPASLLTGCCGAHGGTRITVGGLAQLKAQRPELIDAAMATLGQAARAGSEALAGAELELLGQAMNLAHGVLSGLGLVGDAVESAVRAARRAGALGAKMSGAGGAGGAWLAVFADEEASREAAASLRDQGLLILEERLAT